MTPSEALRTRVEDGVLEVTLDRPKANAIDLATSREMGQVFAAFRDDPDLRVAIVRTEGDKFFCAGWDLKAAADGDRGRRRLRRRAASAGSRSCPTSTSRSSPPSTAWRWAAASSWPCRAT